VLLWKLVNYLIVVLSRYMFIPFCDGLMVHGLLLSSTFPIVNCFLFLETKKKMFH